MWNCIKRGCHPRSPLLLREEAISLMEEQYLAKFEAIYKLLVRLNETELRYGRNESFIRLCAYSKQRVKL